MDTQLARQKLGKKTHPNNGSRHHPTAAMVPSPQRRRIQQLANMLHDKSMSLKLENIIVFSLEFIGYIKAQHIVDGLGLCVCGLGQRAALRVSFSQRAALTIS
jgi:hypothetical protein